jgi:hypothetical protein
VIGQFPVSVAADQVFFDAATGYRTGMNTVLAHHQHGTPGAGRRTPGFGDSYQGNMVAAIKPVNGGLQYFAVGAVNSHGSFLVLREKNLL